MVNAVNIGTAQVANRAFVPLAIEAGIEAVIQSVAGLGMDNRTLLLRLKEELDSTNPELAMALNTQTLDAILDFLATKTSAIIPAKDLPVMIDEAGPGSVTAGWDGGVANQLNITFSEPPAGYTAEIYIDGVYTKDSKAAASGGWVNDSIMALSASTVRVLFRDSQGQVTKFGPVFSLNQKS